MISFSLFSFYFHFPKGRKEEFSAPLVYALIVNKTTEIYETVFEVAKDAERQPTSILMDFELATMNAVRLVFPDVKIAGCFFHFCQAIYRNIQNHGLQVK